MSHICIFFLFLNIYYSILQVRGLGVTQLVIFCERHKCLTPKWFKITTSSVIEAVVSCSTSSQIHFDCHSEHTTSNPQLLPLSNQLMTKLKDPWHVILHVKKTGVMNIASWLPSNKTRSTRKYSRCSSYIFFLPRTSGIPFCCFQ